MNPSRVTPVEGLGASSGVTSARLLRVIVDPPQCTSQSPPSSPPPLRPVGSGSNRTDCVTMVSKRSATRPAFEEAVHIPPTERGYSASGGSARIKLRAMCVSVHAPARCVVMAFSRVVDARCRLIRGGHHPPLSFIMEASVRRPYALVQRDINDRRHPAG